MDETLKGINASTSGMKKSEKAHAHSGLLSYILGVNWPLDAIGL